MDEFFNPIDPLPKVWDPNTRIADMLRGKRGLIVGIANERSIAFGCAAKLKSSGAELALTYVNKKTERYVRPLGEQLQASLIMPLDTEKQGELDAVFERIASEWGRLDFLIHSIASVPKEDLRGRVIDCSLQGFEKGMRVSCYSFIEMARRAEPLMTEGGVLVTMSYYGADKVIDNYNIMGPAKAALESAVRYLAVELGDKGIRVYAVSPGPQKTRASSGLVALENLVENAVARTPEHRLVDIGEVGRVVAFLVSGAASGMTGDTIYVDAGFHNMA